MLLLYIKPMENKKLLAVIFALCMLCDLSITAFAKEELYYENVDFAGAVMSYYDEENSVFLDITINEDGTYINPRGQISASDLSLANMYAKYKDSAGRLSYIKIIYNYKL